MYTIDLLLVIAFCALGRSTHGEPPFGGDFLVTAGLFVAGLVLGWLVNRLALGGHTEALRAGAVAYAATLIGGMLLRALTGQGTAPAFVIVAAVTLAVLLPGWRLAVLAVRRLRRA